MADKNNPRWINFLEQIADSWSHNDRTREANEKDREVHNNILRTLVSGKQLSDKQHLAFVRSIQKRVPFQGAFIWSGPIHLTRRQVRYLSESGKYGKLVNAFSRPVQGHENFDLPRFVADLSGVCQPNVGELAENCGKAAIFSSQSNELRSLQRQDTTEQDADRGKAIVSDHQFSPSYGVGDKLQHMTSASMLTHVAQGVASPYGDWGSTQFGSLGTDYFGGVEYTVAARAQIAAPVPLAPRISDLVPAVGNAALWYDAGKSLAGTIMIDGQHLYLRFANYVFHQTNFFIAHQDNGADRDWHREIYQPKLTSDLSQFDGSRQLHDRPDWYSFALSPVYGKRKDTALARQRTMVRSIWGEDLKGGKPTALVILIDGSEQLVPLKENTRSSHANAPHYVSA